MCFALLLGKWQSLLLLLCFLKGPSGAAVKVTAEEGRARFICGPDRTNKESGSGLPGL